jgi:hypothetical protein
MLSLIYASYVSSRNVLVDLISLWMNLEPPLCPKITAKDQKLLDTKGFVLEARDYSTLSATIIVTVPCVLVFLSLVLIALEVNMRLTVIKEYKKTPTQQGRPIKDTYASRLRFLK